ncbi:hypothetical protein CGGC5_v014386 [Colletotrichum fructicola Nara gc5]|uniref:Uncharacterized protein n=1 Tax=Colletotrichum fructicola (strain Nara gc5) TaxID=1213859 RepID=A0A7J6IKM3_COLFN|nr:hypothetical protein CGGC5_v014386 [Colletotrichum fructicola Nara gc5]
MPAQDDKAFYDMLDSIANTGNEDAVQQNKLSYFTALNARDIQAKKRVSFVILGNGTLCQIRNYIIQLASRYYLHMMTFFGSQENIEGQM